MSDVKKLTTDNGLIEYIECDLTYEELPEDMKAEFADGKGGED